PRGATISYYFKKPVEDKNVEKEDEDEDDDKNMDETTPDETEGKHKDSLYMRFYDGQNLIRTLKRKIPDSSGMYRWRWFMNEAGVTRPSRRIREVKNEPGGIGVKPGIYRVELSYLESKSVTNIKVESDPRLKVTQKAINDRYAYGKKLQEMTGVAAEVVKQLVESKNTVEDFQKKLKKKDKEKYKEDLKSGKEVIKKIDNLIALYLGKEDKRQGITRNPEVTVMQRIGTANRYVRSRPDGLTATEERLLEQAEDQFNAAIEETNNFFVTKWAEYRSKLEQMDLSPFKETKTF
ncbi:MAG: hypothetical protein HKP11_03795, partial [Flavobacteriaceae bacterium]|nr:hypothetical protein [Flavobacteriaceae bacterium]